MTEKRFESIFKNEFKSYFDFKLSNGYSIKSFYYLFVLYKFLKNNKYDKDYIDKEIIYKYYESSLKQTKNSKIERLIHIIPFLKYLNTIGIKAYIPTIVGKKSKSTPYVLTYDEIKILFKTMDNFFKDRKSNYYNYEYPILFRLLYTTGMRINEACNLKIEDVYISEKYIQVNSAKNNKSRFVYLSDSMTHILLKYIYKMKSMVTSDWLFPSSNPQTPIHKSNADRIFSYIVTMANIGSQKHHPVPHSLRHSYVVHKIDSWIKENNDFNLLMPYLSKQLGHSSIKETYYYYHTISSSFNSIKDKTNNLYPEVEYETC